MSAIEVEKKFLPSKEQLASLLEGAELVSEKVIQDSYFDDNAHKTTTQNYWLRLRDGKYELKAPFKSADSSSVKTNRYRELDTSEEIAEELGLDLQGSLAETLEAAGVRPFITHITTRQTYKKDGFTIDVDAAKYVDSDFTYNIVEIELLVADELEADTAEEKIVAYAKSHGLVTDQLILGKVGEFLKHEHPDHYQLLVETGVFA